MLEPRLGPSLAVVNGVIHAVGGVSDRNVGGWGAHGGGAPAGAEPFTSQVEKYVMPAAPAGAETANVASSQDGGPLNWALVPEGVGEWVACPEMECPVAFHACFASGLTPLYD